MDELESPRDGNALAKTGCASIQASANKAGRKNVIALSLQNKQ